MNYKTLIAGALGGLLTAVAVDINAWAKSPSGSAFDWGLAFKRWVAGLVTGLSSGATVGVIE